MKPYRMVLKSVKSIKLSLDHSILL